MFALAVAIEALLPCQILHPAIQELARYRHGRVIAIRQKSAKLMKECALGIWIARLPASREERSFDLVLGADKQEVNEVRFFAVTGRGAEGYFVEQHLDIAALVFIHLEGNVRKFGLVAYVERGVQAQAHVGARRQIDLRLG